MPHLCEAAVVTCEDFRLHQRADGRNCIGDFIRSLGVDSDLITRGGGIQDLVRPQPGCDRALLRDLRVSVELHQVKTICLIAHEDCGAYRGFQFRSKEDERRQHRDDLQEARRLILQEFPRLDVALYFAELAPGSEDDFVVKPLA